MLKLGIKSLKNRRFVVGLTVLSIALSVALILGVERLKNQARDSFASSVSGVDLIIAPRGNDVQILMATVFGVGSTGVGMTWDSFAEIRDLPPVEWAVPVLMGDNHRGYPVVGTTAEYFDHYRHSGGRALSFAAGDVFSNERTAVIGAQVASAFGYAVGDEIINAHGAGANSFEMHDDSPFVISGILARTGTAVDRMVYVSLLGFETLHTELARPAADPFSADENAETPSANPDHINAAFVGLKRRAAVLAVQRFVAEYPAEALSAVMPNVALLSLWSVTGTAESALQLMAGAVALAGVIGMVVMLSASLETRRREFAILRSVGATPGNIFGLILMEAALVAMAGLVLGYFVLVVATTAVDPILTTRFGLSIGALFPSEDELILMAIVFCFAMFASLLPAWRVYRMTLSDGLTMRS